MDLPLPEAEIVDEYFQGLEFEVRSIRPGRSGARVFLAKLARNGVPMQPEFVKLDAAKSIEREYANFLKFASGTQLVYGLKPNREPIYRKDKGLFSLPLFEAGEEVCSLGAFVLANPSDAAAVISKSTSMLIDWYNFRTTKMSLFELVDEQRIASAIEAVRSIDNQVAMKCQAVLARVNRHPFPGSGSQIHGDLHLENILVAKQSATPYLIDFANASESGLAPFDLSRLESDLINRLLPLDSTPEQCVEIEKALLGESNTKIRWEIGKLIEALRSAAKPVLQDPNNANWYLVGRIVNNLRMISGTWKELFPFSSEVRQASIVACIGFLTKRLKTSLDGNLKLLTHNGFCSDVQNASLGEETIRSLYLARQYDTASDLATRIVSAASVPNERIQLLGLLARSVFDRSCPEPRDSNSNDSFLRGIRTLVHCAIGKHSESTAEFSQEIRKARSHFHDAGDTEFEAVTLDQYARALHSEGNAELAKIAFSESINLKKSSADIAGLATSLGGLANLHLTTHSYGKALDELEENLRLSEQSDENTRSKIHNWIGQVKLESQLDLVGAREQFKMSLDLATDKETLAYAHLSSGFAAIRGEAFGEAAQHSERAIELYNGCKPSALRNHGILLTEILSAELLFARRYPESGLLRLTSGLKGLEGMHSFLSLLDYGVRSAKYLTEVEYPDFAELIRKELRPVLSNVNVSHEFWEIVNGGRA